MNNAQDGYSFFQNWLGDRYPTSTDPLETYLANQYLLYASGAATVTADVQAAMNAAAAALTSQSFQIGLDSSFAAATARLQIVAQAGQQLEIGVPSVLRTQTTLTISDSIALKVGPLTNSENVTLSTSEVSSLIKGLQATAFALAYGIGAYSIATATDPDDEMHKQTTMFDVAYVSSTLITTALNTFYKVPLPVASAIGAASGGIIAFVIDNSWAEIKSAWQTAEALSKTALEFSDEFADSLSSQGFAALEAIGSDAADIVEDGAAFLSQQLNNFADLLGPTPVFTNDIPPHIQEMALFFHTAFSTSSPLILDLNGDGVQTASLTGSNAVYWDVDNDGFREASGWVSAQDGLLVRDLNSNGVIDNHSELFGSTTTDGFTVLTALDSNSDNAITSADSAWSTLKVWQDTNGDGISQSDELHTLGSLGITSISLADSTVSETNNGNSVTHRSTFVMNGNTHNIDDVWFTYDNTNSVDVRPYTFDPDTLLLPELRGYGDVSTFSIAMSNDNTGTGNLKGLVQDVADQYLEPPVWMTVQSASLWAARA